MRVARPISIAFLLAALLGTGCGSDSDGGGETGNGSADGAPTGATSTLCPTEADRLLGPLRATGLDCDAALQTASDWLDDRNCAPPADASRSSCEVGDYRCLAAVVGRGIAVSCSQPERSMAFIVRRSG